ncbi:hypothetical protein DB31_6378 [Hyalangium minutum]|uniref:Uncharacterized protein n=1 Tax=Hyalangium minutum TaxID=394096 RepID=A0A085WNZ0_9BACT|nr:hypothetical protein DB31_6378 [Hyalangium minutum]
MEVSLPTREEQRHGRAQDDAGLTVRAQRPIKGSPMDAD